jgi:hypothetical protein
MSAKNGRDASHVRDVNNRRESNKGGNTRNRKDVNNSTKQQKATQQHCRDANKRIDANNSGNTRKKRDVNNSRSQQQQNRQQQHATCTKYNSVVNPQQGDKQL